MKQEAALFAWQGLDHYDGIRPLENFLWVHVRNRLYNLKRNNYSRLDKPCDKCPLNAYVNNCCTEYDNMMDCTLYSKWKARNTTKKNLMSTKQSDDVAYSQHTTLEDTVFSREIYTIVDNNIPISMREDWLRFVNKLKLPKSKREALLEHIKIILSDHGIES